MIAILQWIALGVCLACTAWRLPAMLQRRNSGLFWAFLMTAVAVGLSLPGIYLPVDAVLGGRNFANLILRFALYAIFLIIAAKIAAAYRSARSERLIRGPVGICVLLLVGAATIVLFLMSDLPVSSTGLAGYDNQRSVSVYALLGRLYPAYASLCLVLPSARAARTAARRIDRLAAVLLSTGFCLVVGLTAAQLTSLRLPMLIALLSYVSILCVATGLALVWVSLGTKRRKAARTAGRPGARNQRGQDSDSVI